jgi:hypothetical protein
MVNDGCKVAIRIEPFMYPMANVLQSAAGASAVIGSNIVLADMCSDVVGSKRITLPCELPDEMVSGCGLYGIIFYLPNAIFEFFIHAAVLISSYEANLAISSPVTTSHTMVVRLLS